MAAAMLAALLVVALAAGAPTAMYQWVKRPRLAKLALVVAIAAGGILAAVITWAFGSQASPPV